MIVAPTAGRHVVGDKYATSVTKVKFRGRDNTSKEVECKTCRVIWET